VRVEGTQGGGKECRRVEGTQGWWMELREGCRNAVRVEGTQGG